jgi:hypothetical protein
MFETCYLHCGHAKTGSSSIQATFAANRSLIETEGGFMYPETHNVAPGNHVEQAVTPYVDKLRGMMKPPAKDNLLQQALNEGKTRGGNLVLSSEALMFLKETELQKLKADLLPACRNIKVVIYARHPITYAPSFAQTQIKNNLRSLRVCSEIPKFVRYKTALKKFIQVFGQDNLIIRDFARSKLERQDIVADFLQVVCQRPEIMDDPKFQMKRMNESLSLQAIVVADYLYRT